MSVHQSAHWPAMLVTGLNLVFSSIKTSQTVTKYKPGPQGPSSATVAAWSSVYWPSLRDAMTHVIQRKT